jgi:acyl dehydratase
VGGLYFESFTSGSVYAHAAARSVTQFDNLWHSCMTLNTQPLHVNLDFAATSGMYKRPLFNSMYTLAIVIGQTTADLTRGTLLETLLLTDIEFPRPVFDGDTLYSRSTVLSTDASADHPEGGIVELFHEGLNQEKQVVATCKRRILVRRRPRA